MKYYSKRYYQILIAPLALLVMPGVAYSQERAGSPVEIALTDFVPGDHGIDLAKGDQNAPAVYAANGVTLAAWADQRSHAGGAIFPEHETASDIYGMFLSPDGSPQTSLPFAIAQGKASQSTPRISWNGSNWLVVFTTTGLSGTGFYYQPTLAAVRVTATGEVLDKQPIPLYNTPSSSNQWAVASDGADWFIAYEDNSLFVTKLNANGQSQPPTLLPVPRDTYPRTNLQLACASGTCLFTFDDYVSLGLNYTGAIRFDSEVNVLGSGYYTLVESSLAALVANDAGFYAVWEEWLPNFRTAVFGSRIDPQGNLLDAGGDDISLGLQPQGKPVLGWDGVNWRVAWPANTGVRIARVSPAGQVLDAGGVLVPGAALGATTVTSNASLQTVRSEFANNEYDVFTNNISSAYVAGPDVPLSIGEPAQTRANSAIGNAGIMVVYLSDFATGIRLMAQPLDANGVPLTSEPVLIDSGTWSTGPGTPSVAWNGSSYVVTWGINGNVYAQRMLQDGSLIDPNPVLIMPGFGPANVAAIGNTYLIIGRQFGFTTQIINVYAARLDGATGAVLDATPLIVGSNHARSTSLTTMGDRWFLAYQRNVTHDDPLADTRGVFINTDGTVNPEIQIYGYYSSTGGNSIFKVATAASDNTALVVQSAETTSGVETDLIGVLVNSNGSVQPALNLTPWLGNQYRPRLTWDGAQFIMAYNEQRNRFAPLTLDQLDARSDLYGMRISETGAVVDPQGFVFSNSPLSEAYPGVVAANGVAFFTGSVMRNAQAAYRVGYRQLGMQDNQWPVAVAGADVLLGDVPFTVNFNATGSTDTDGSVVSYLWEFGDGATASQTHPSHEYTSPGDYTVMLKVTDDLGAATSNALAITAQAPNIDPIAAISADVSFGPAPLRVVFDAAGSYDPDGTIGNIEWDFGDGGFPYYGSPAYNTFSTEGEYTVTVTVFDGRGGSGTASMVIYVGFDGDTDGDGVPDSADNCSAVSNPDQRDTNGDGYGNACDPDLNDDGDVNFVDLGLMKEAFFGTDAAADLNGDGVVNFLDLAIMKELFFGPPGPSGTVP